MKAQEDFAPSLKLFFELAPHCSLARLQTTTAKLPLAQDGHMKQDGGEKEERKKERETFLTPRPEDKHFYPVHARWMSFKRKQTALK